MNITLVDTLDLSYIKNIEYIRKFITYNNENLVLLSIPEFVSNNIFRLNTIFISITDDNKITYTENIIIRFTDFNKIGINIYKGFIGIYNDKDNILTLYLTSSENPNYVIGITYNIVFGYKNIYGNDDIIKYEEYSIEYSNMIIEDIKILGGNVRNEDRIENDIYISGRRYYIVIKVNDRYIWEIPIIYNTDERYFNLDIYNKRGVIIENKTDTYKYDNSLFTIFRRE